MGAAANPGYQPLAGEQPEVAPDRDLGDGERVGELRDRDRVARLEQLEHAVHPVARAGASRVPIVSVLAQTRPPSSTFRKASLRFSFT